MRAVLKRSADRTFAARSLFGLNAINFFQAEMVEVIMPILGVLLKEHGWRYDAIDRSERRRSFVLPSKR